MSDPYGAARLDRIEREIALILAALARAGIPVSDPRRGYERAVPPRTHEVRS